MTRVDGEWRIASLDNGLVLTQSDVQETFRQLNLYFLAPSRRVLVPDTVFLPSAPGLSTALVTRLIGGPTEELAAATTTAFPRGTSLAVSSVPVRDGIARVNLDASALKADGAARALMSAQLVWTLKQLPEFQGLQLSVEGDDLSVPGQGQVQSADAWSGLDPAGVEEGVDAVAVRGGRLGRIVSGRFTPVPGPAGSGRPALRQPAVSLDGAQAAGVVDGGRGLVTGRLAENEPLGERLRGSALSTPSWDAGGNLWVVDAPVGRVWMIPDGTRDPVAVKVPKVPAGRITGIRVGRDGARVAVVAGTGAQARLYVGSIVRGRAGAPTAAIEHLTETLPELRSVRSVAWADATTLAVLGAQSGGQVAPLLTDTDGYDVAPVEPETGLVSMAAAPQQRPLLAGTAGGRLAQYTSGRGWVDLGPGRGSGLPRLTRRSTSRCRAQPRPPFRRDAQPTATLARWLDDFGWRALPSSTWCCRASAPAARATPARARCCARAAGSSSPVRRAWRGRHLCRPGCRHRGPSPTTTAPRAARSSRTRRTEDTPWSARWGTPLPGRCWPGWRPRLTRPLTSPWCRSRPVVPPCAGAVRTRRCDSPAGPPPPFAGPARTSRCFPSCAPSAAWPTRPGWMRASARPICTERWPFRAGSPVMCAVARWSWSTT